MFVRKLVFLSVAPHVTGGPCSLEWVQFRASTGSCTLNLGAFTRGSCVLVTCQQPSDCGLWLDRAGAALEPTDWQEGTGHKRPPFSWVLDSCDGGARQPSQALRPGGL